MIKSTRKKSLPVIAGLLLFGLGTMSAAQNTPGYNNKIPESILAAETVVIDKVQIQFFQGECKERCLPELHFLSLLTVANLSESKKRCLLR